MCFYSITFPWVDSSSPTASPGLLVQPLARIIAGPNFHQRIHKQHEVTTIHLEKGYLNAAHLGGASLSGAHLGGADLAATHLEGATLNAAFFDRATQLEEIVLSSNKFGTAFLCDIRWGDVNVAQVDWSTISTLGEENNVKHGKNDYGYAMAARAYRQLSVVLRNQGRNEYAARFAHRAQII